MKRSQAIEIAKELFPCKIYGTNYNSLGHLIRKDRIASVDLLDHIQYNEPLPQGTIEKYDLLERELI